MFDNYKYWHYSWKFLVFILLSVVPKLLMANTTFTLSQFAARLKLWSYIRKVIVLIVSNLTRTWGLVRKSCWSQRFYLKKKFLVKKFLKSKRLILIFNRFMCDLRIRLHCIITKLNMSYLIVSPHVDYLGQSWTRQTKYLSWPFIVTIRIKMYRLASPCIQS